MVPEEEDTLDWLPDGWITGLKMRTNEKLDRYYTCPISGSTFRSQEEVLRYLTFEKDDRLPSAAFVYNGELSDHNRPPNAKAQDDSPLWLPHGWVMEIKTRKCGTRYKCYVEPSSGCRFYSKPEVFRYLLKGKTSTEEMSVNENPSDHILAQIECSPVGLPPGWIKELKYRRNSSGLRKDPYYKDPASGYIFRTKKDANRYLETGEAGKYAIIHARGKSISAKYNIDGFPPSITANVPNQEEDVANHRLFASPISNSTIEIAENVAGLSVNGLLLQNIEHETPDGNNMTSITANVPNQEDVANRRLFALPISNSTIEIAENVAGLPVEGLLLQNIEHETPDGNDMTSITANVPNQEDVANRQLFASPISNSTIEIAENVAGLPAEGLLFQNIEHETPDGIEGSGQSFVAMLNGNSNPADGNPQICQGCQPGAISETPSEHDHKMMLPKSKSKSDLMFSNSGSSRMSYPLDTNLLGENKTSFGSKNCNDKPATKSNEGKSPDPMGGIDSSDLPPKKSSDVVNGANMSTCHLRSRQNSEPESQLPCEQQRLSYEKAVAKKSIEPMNIKNTATEMPTRRATQSHQCDSSNAASTKWETRSTCLGSSIEKNTRPETHSSCHGSSSEKNTRLRSHHGSSNEKTARHETHSSYHGSSSEVMARRETRSSRLGPYIEMTTKRETQRVCHGSSSSGTTAGRETRSSRLGPSIEMTTKRETRRGRRGSSSSGTTIRRETRSSRLGPSIEMTTKRETQRGRCGSSSSGTTTRHETRNNRLGSSSGSSSKTPTRPETRRRCGHGPPSNYIIYAKQRASKRLAGHDPDLTPDIDPTYRSIRKVIRRTTVAGNENGDGSSSIMAIDNIKEVEIMPGAATELPAECPLEIASPFGDTWPDPCIEFAFKTLTGDIPNFEDSAIVQYFKQQLTSTVNNPTTTTSSPAFAQNFVKIEFDADHESMNRHDVVQVKINQEFCTVTKNEIIPPSNGETNHR